jgi:hypothetical protein
LDSTGEIWSEKIETQANDVHTDGALWYGIQTPVPSALTSPTSFQTWMVDTPGTPLNREYTRPDKPWKITGRDQFIAWLCVVPDKKDPPACIYYVIWNTVWDVLAERANNPLIGTDQKASVDKQGEGQGSCSPVTSPTSFKVVKSSGKY